MTSEWSDRIHCGLKCLGLKCSHEKFCLCIKISWVEISNMHIFSVSRQKGMPIWYFAVMWQDMCSAHRGQEITTGWRLCLYIGMMSQYWSMPENWVKQDRVLNRKWQRGRLLLARKNWWFSLKIERENICIVSRICPEFVMKHLWACNLYLSPARRPAAKSFV